MKRIVLAATIMALALNGAWAQEVPDADDDGIADMIEWRLGCDPQRAEQLEAICEAPGTAADDAPARLDLVEVRFANVAKDRWLFAMEFADDFTFENCYVLMYIDADNDASTGRPGFGNEYYWTISAPKPGGYVYTHRGERLVSPPPRVVLDGRVVYVCGEAPILQQDGRSRFRLSIAVETRDPCRKTDAIAFTSCEGPPNSDRPPAGGLATVRGTVLGPRDAPVVGALVRVYAMPEDGSLGTLTPAGEAVSGEDGRFELEVHGGSYLPSASAGTFVLSSPPDLAPELWRLVPGVLSDEVTLRLTEGASVTGTVVGPDGNPLPDAQIVSDLGYGASADNNGEFTIEAIPAGERQLLARSGDLVGIASPLLAAGVEAQVRLTLAQSVTLRGTVTSEATGEPVEGATVRLETEDRGLLNVAARAVTGADGRYEVARVPADWVTGEVTISHSDFPDQVHGVPPGEPDEAPLRADFAMHTGYAVAGRVLLPDGTPAAETLVRLGVSRGFDASGACQADDHGRFRLDGLPDSYEQVLVTELEGYAPAATLVRPGRGEDTPHMELTLEPGHEITGRLLNHSGAPLQHQSLQAAISEEGYMAHVGHFQRTDGDGWWTYPDLPAEGAFILRAAGQVVVEVPVSVGAENVYQSPPTGAVGGRVVDGDSGEPITHFGLAILPTGAEEASSVRVSEHYARHVTVTNDDGRFEMTGVPMGVPMRLRIGAEGYEAATIGPVEAQAATDDDRPPAIELTREGGR